MKTIGSLVLFVSIGLLLVGGMHSLQDMTNQADTTNDQNIVSQTSSVNAAATPVLFIMGFAVLIIGSVIAIDAFK